MTATRLRRPRQLRLAEWVFQQLATEILEGEVEAGATLPSENALAQRFGVSRMIMRQAIHRLAELDLVAVRQGGATSVLDVGQSADIRVLELLYRLAPSQGAPLVDPRDVVEKQLLQGLALVDIAERRARASSLAAIARETERACAAAAGEADFLALEERFWQAVASAGGNRILRMEVNWWYGRLPARPRAEHLVPSPLSARLAFYRALADRLRARDGAAAWYLEAVRPLLRAFFDAPKEPTR